MLNIFTKWKVCPKYGSRCLRFQLMPLHNYITTGHCWWLTQLLFTACVHQSVNVDDCIFSIWLTWDCRDSVSSALRDTVHRSDDQMLPHPRTLTARLSIYVSSSHPESLLSSETSESSISTSQYPRWAPVIWSNAKVHLFRAPVCQRPQMCQHTQVGEICILQLSLSHLSQHWAQSQHLICPHLLHWTEDLEGVKNQRMVLALYFIFKFTFTAIKKAGILRHQ